MTLGHKHIWYLDSGYSRHMTSSKSLLEGYFKQDRPSVTFGDNHKCQSWLNDMVKLPIISSKEESVISHTFIFLVIRVMS